MLYKLPGTAGKGGGVSDFALADTSPGICPICDLIDVISDGGQLAQQGGVLIRRAWEEQRAGNQLSDMGADTQSCYGALFLQMSVLFFIQP